MSRFDPRSLPVRDARYDHKVEGSPGLFVRVSPDGRRAWYWIRRVRSLGSRVVRIKVANVDELGVREARKLADGLNGVMVTGGDPREHLASPKTQEEDLTVSGPNPCFSEVFAHYLNVYAKAHKKSWRQDEKCYEARLSVWADTPVRDIQRADVRALHVGMKATPVLANRTLALIHKVFAVWLEDHEGANPADAIRKYPEHSRDRFLQPLEIAAFFTALELEDPTYQDYFRLLLFVGARGDNVRHMKWDQLDFDTKVWRIPVTKNGDAQKVPLVDAALEVLSERKDYASASPWVFPSVRRAGPISYPSRPWTRVCERAGLENITPHDLRRTLASYQIRNGSSLKVVGTSLGHRSQQSTEVYARTDLSPVRDSMSVAVADIMENLKNT